MRQLQHQAGWMRWAVGIIALVSISVPAGGYAYLYKQSDKLIFFKYGEEGWAQERPGQCTEARNYYFSDLRPNAKQKVLELSCEKGSEYAYESFYPQTDDGLKIHAKLFKSDKPRPLLVHVPGLTSTWLDATRYIPMAKRMGFQLVTFEMRNHGVSGNNGKGIAYGCQEWQDLMAVIKHLNERFPRRHIYLWGSSMGSMTVLNAAPKFQNKYPNIKAIILENPPSSVRDIVEHQSPGLPPVLYTLMVSIAGQRAESNFETCSPTAMAGKLKLPTLITVSENDTTTPPEMANKVFGALPHHTGNQLIVYDQGSHSAIWNGQPQRYELDLKGHWEKNVPIAIREAQEILLAKEASPNKKDEAKSEVRKK